MMTFEQGEEDNRTEFVERLVDAGWSKEEAEQEWRLIQDDEDD